MAAGASVMFLQVRRWLWGAIEDKLLRKFETESKHGLSEIKNSCRQSVEAFCDVTDAYYQNQIENALRMQYRSEWIDRKTKLDQLFQLSDRLNVYRHKAKELKQQQGALQPNYLDVIE
ncbi:uncharacterized protein LOC105439944 [Strongylocentrotus purpuratus]|uniref:Uncharacterized protein n=1 Tax=Strongylocentrotus purpuratus TaxID=7668 RepID=A0A7M7STT5_STRPU|nr:uncharacterized protein LOC105439944 [Strongylocentrotus purpuratus]